MSRLRSAGKGFRCYSLLFFTIKVGFKALEIMLKCKNSSNTLEFYFLFSMLLCWLQVGAVVEIAICSFPFHTHFDIETLITCVHCV